ncbi:hypothetical protein [Nocardioides sp. 503]|uniref:hypothetical protein n=1 Tax=Nocardioides sp. 503 TaxID=2508326 RepID=UPI00106F82D4|nr:hypothetical protein [Nocardioides sp. 503]
MSPLRRLDLALAWVSLTLFAVAVVVAVRATEHAWDVEAEFVLGPDDDQSLYGIAYLVYAAVLAPAALAHLVSVAVATVRAASRRAPGGAAWATAWVAYGLGVLCTAGVAAMGVAFALGLDAAPDREQTRTLLYAVAPVVICALAAVVPLLGRGLTPASD